MWERFPGAVTSRAFSPSICRRCHEQRRIVAEFDALKRLQAETAAELDALLPAFLDRAYKGHW